jgi:hypothetical protein
MSVGTGGEIQAKGVNRSVILVAERLKTVGDDGQDTVILVVGKAIEKLVIVVDLPVEAAQCLCLAEGRVVIANEGRERTTGKNRIEQILFGALAIQKEK